MATADADGAETDDDTPTPPAGLRNIPRSSYTARIIKQKVWRRCNVENQHFMGVIVGREGTGKSHTALRICNGVDPSFDADRVFFDPSRLLETVQSGDLGTGHAVVVDEAGVGLGNRTWYEEDQVRLNQALQTIRDDNMCVVFTLPRLSELDSQTRGRLHSYIEMTQVNSTEGYADARWLNVKPSRDETAEIYKKYPRLQDRGRKKVIKRVRFTPPAPALVESYEERKAAFKQELFDDVLSEDVDESSADADPSEIATEIADEGVEPFVAENGSTGAAYINKDLIRVEYDLSHSDARAVKTMLEQGYSAEELEDRK